MMDRNMTKIECLCCNNLIYQQSVRAFFVCQLCLFWLNFVQTKSVKEALDNDSCSDVQFREDTKMTSTTFTITVDNNQR